MTRIERSFYYLDMAVPARSEDVARGIDHVTITTPDVRAAKRFYERALRPLGFSIVFDWPHGGRAYLGVDSEPSSLWLVESGDPRRATVAFAAPDRTAVDAFYAAALAAGGQPVAPPASRPEYTTSTYAAEVLDPDGNALEAVCRSAEPLAGSKAA